MWVIQVFNTNTDELVAERVLASVDQQFLTNVSGLGMFAAIPLDHDMLVRLGADDLMTAENQEAFLELQA